MPTENRIKDTQNMSLHLHNPYIVSMQGSLKITGFPVLCGGGACGKNGVHEPGPQPMQDAGLKPDSEPQAPPQQHAGAKSMPGAGPEAASEPVKGAASQWEKVLDDNGKFFYMNHDTGQFSYEKPEGWSENEADTEATQITEEKATQNAESQELSRFKHCTACYLPVELKTMESYLNMYQRSRSFGWMLSLMMLSMANFFKKTLDDANEKQDTETEQDDANREQDTKTEHTMETLSDFIMEKGLQQSVLFRFTSDLQQLQDKQYLLEGKQYLNKMQQILDKYSHEPTNTSAQSDKSSSVSESDSAELNDDVSESWTYKCNTTRSFTVWHTEFFRTYDAVHVTFTDNFVMVVVVRVGAG
jgi:hypothetical protein